VTTNFPEAGQKIYTLGGLPLWTAILYAALFSIAFCSYSLLWKKAPVMEPDSDSYLRVAQDLSDFHIDQLPLRRCCCILHRFGCLPAFFTALARRN
jgi:hypothetical protein